MYKTEETKLKMFTFIVRQQNIQTPGESVGVIFGYTLDKAFAKIQEAFIEHFKGQDVQVFIKHTGTHEVDALGLEMFIPEDKYERKIIKRKEEQFESVGSKLSGLLTYLINDKNAGKDRKKLTKTDISNLKRIIQKL